MSFDDGVEAVSEDALAHGFGLLAVGERADLDVEEFVLGLVADGYDVAFFLERGEEDVGDILTGDGGDLDYEGSCRLQVACGGWRGGGGELVAYDQAVGRACGARCARGRRWC